ncbi:hypothetical protein [Nitrospina watsonii]|uniref:Cbb3-type cytochrome c oxidase subunit CcoP N-terminal domain-containing protein n=1 Tax=Nitrospina watsonii TaxID=1323948 RepID=A0ABM9HGL5_9BACT|nr:hypothetical protein [Nitrospina watsonii]CAI2719492.1 conserved protein of unknown function [Nitrospina watsonii]
MAAAENKKTPQTGEPGKQDPHSPDKEYTYQASGIRERHGTIPLWLMLVCLGLLVWGGYYMWTYWSPPGVG